MSQKFANRDVINDTRKFQVQVDKVDSIANANCLPEVSSSPVNKKPDRILTTESNDFSFPVPQRQKPYPVRDCFKGTSYFFHIPTLLRLLPYPNSQLANQKPSLLS